jgi:hypothetical protein
MTCESVVFPPVRRWVCVTFYNYRFVSGANRISNRFVSLDLVLLNPYPVFMVPGLKLKHAINSCIECVRHQNWVNIYVMNHKCGSKTQIL